MRWVLGEQSARLLRGGKMEDVIFQGSTARRPVNVTEVSLYLDNTDGDLPIAYREVVVTRRLSRSGQSDYLLNGSPVRLRDIQDLLRGTGLGSDAGVVIEAKMIDLLLSDRADERRSLFEEAAGIGLYRDRKHSTERRLEETAADLQRVEDLIAEVQSQIRSLARQRGKAERHAKLTEEKFAVQVTLARRLLERLRDEAAGMEARFAELAELLPAARQRLAEASSGARSGRAGPRRRRRPSAPRSPGAWRPSGSSSAGSTATSPSRPSGWPTPRRAGSARRRSGPRWSSGPQQRCAGAGRGRRRPRGRGRASTTASARELAGRAEAEEDVRRRLGEQRATGARAGAGRCRRHAQTLRSLEGERAALEGELASLRERAAQAAAHRASLQAELADAERRRDHAVERAGFLSHEAKRAAADAEHARHLVAEAREQEAMHRSDRRRAEEALAQLTARRHALEELERDRVGLAPAAAALLAARERFDGGVLGPAQRFRQHRAATTPSWPSGCSATGCTPCWCATTTPVQRDPGLARRAAARRAGPAPARSRSALPADGPAARRPAPGRGPGGRLGPGGAGRVRGARRPPAACSAGRAARSSSPAPARPVGPAPPPGRARRRWPQDVGRAERHAGRRRRRALQATIVARWPSAEQALASAAAAAEQAREAERQAIAAREDALRMVGQSDAARSPKSEAQLDPRDRAAQPRPSSGWRRSTPRWSQGDLARGRLDEELGGGRGRLAELEAEQEAAREQRVHWQVQEAHVAGGLRSADERLQRAGPDARARPKRAARAWPASWRSSRPTPRPWRRSRRSGAKPRAERQVALQELEAASVDGRSRPWRRPKRRCRRRARGGRAARRARRGERGEPPPPGAAHRSRRHRAAASWSGSKPSGTGRSSS